MAELRSLADVLKTTPRLAAIVNALPKPSETHGSLQTRALSPDESSSRASDCDRCRGAGWVRQPPAVPGMAGELVPCVCTRDRLAEKAWAVARTAANLGKRHDAMTFEAFDRRDQPAAYDSARAFADAPDHWLVMYGKTGTGKTHLLSACANELLRRGERPVYWVVPDMLAYLQEGYSAKDFPARLQPILDAAVLLLDDYGAETFSEDKNAIMFRIVNHRLDHDLPLAVTTNAQPGDFPARIDSRLRDESHVVGVIMQPGDRRTGRR